MDTKSVRIVVSIMVMACSEACTEESSQTPGTPAPSGSPTDSDESGTAPFRPDAGDDVEANVPALDQSDVDGASVISSVTELLAEYPEVADDLWAGISELDVNVPGGWQAGPGDVTGRILETVSWICDNRPGLAGDVLGAVMSADPDPLDHGESFAALAADPEWSWLAE